MAAELPASSLMPLGPTTLKLCLFVYSKERVDSEPVVGKQPDEMMPTGAKARM